MPASAALQPSLEVPFRAGGAPPLQLRFVCPADTLDDYYAVEHSTNLLGWLAWPLRALTYQVLPAPHGGKQVTLLPPFLPDANPSFFRLLTTPP